MISLLYLIKDYCQCVSVTGMFRVYDNEGLFSYDISINGKQLFLKGYLILFLFYHFRYFEDLTKSS